MKSEKIFTGDSMKMFTAKEEKNLTYVLDKAEEEESLMLPEELHGFLFGLTITPDPITPSEWLPVVLDKEPQFKDDKEEQTCIGYLMDAYNRIIHDSNCGKLFFPFNYEKLSDLEYEMIEGWAYGLYRALSIRPHIWGMSEEYEDMKEDDIPAALADVIDACITITAIALPEERDEIFGSVAGEKPRDPEELEEAIYNMLPSCVEIIQLYGEKLRGEMNPSASTPASLGYQQTGNPGRNDLCPCGSGKKYKKCCGNN